EALRASGSSWAIETSHLVAVPVLGGDGQGWKSLLHTPDLSQFGNAKVWVGAATLAIVASLETLLNLEATDKLDPQRRHSPPNSELVAQGVGNLIAGAVGGMPMTSVIIRSSVNANAGSRTRLAAIVHGLLLAVCVFLLPGLLNRIPLAALAAILVVTGFKLASPALFRAMWREGRGQFAPFIVTLVAIVLTDLLVGVGIGLAVSLLFLLNSSLRRGVTIFREAHAAGTVHRIELAEQVSFLNRATLQQALARFGRGDQVMIDASQNDYIDPDILGLIRAYRDEAGPARGVSVSLVGFEQRNLLLDRVQYVDVSTRDVQASLRPEHVLQILREGNRRFIDGTRLHRDLSRQVDATSAGQHPMAVVLGCIDSRAPVEMVFDVGIGDLFVCRLAGNVISPMALGSMEFACKVAGAKLVLVLGHTRCGAVKAACDFAASGKDVRETTGLDNLGSLIEPIKRAVALERETE
ncbi:MAG: bifunctional SulP family inorganic anion transporter/carbonic anhydrase, partial [Planctomycetota bacterium]